MGGGMKRLELAVVGCGEIAGYAALVSKLIPQIRLAACCDVDSERAPAFARRHGIRQVFTDYADLLARGSFQALYLAVPHDLHSPMILQAVEAGKPVLVEKPLARSLSEGVEIVEAAARHSVKVGVNYQYRYDSGCYALARAVQSGRLGRVHSIRINVPWRRTQAYFDSAPWHKALSRSGGGTLLTQGSHFLDVALWALREPTVSAVGYAASPGFQVEVETLAHGIIQTRGGTLVNIASTMVAAREQAAVIEVYGETGTAMYRDLPFSSVKFVGTRVKPERPPGWGLHALQRSLAGFARWILEEETFLIPAASALPVLAAVDAIYRAARDGLRMEQPMVSGVSGPGK